MRQGIELVSGVLAGAVGLFALTLWTSAEADLGGLALLLLVIAPGVLIVGVAVGAYLHSQLGVAAGAVVLEISTALLWVAAILLDPLRFLLLPALIALVAVAASTGSWGVVRLLAFVVFSGVVLFGLLVTLAY